MQRRQLMLGTAGVLAGALGQGAAPARAAAPVVLELFTSQGCSSCPPADRLLGELTRDPSVIALAWHVDYWNGLGWADPFASRLATDRQRAYAARLGEDVYTPAMVVGGTSMVVGSDRDGIHAAARTTSAAAKVPVVLTAQDGNLSVQIGSVGEPATALLAFYEPEHLTAVAGGENGGRRLHEYHIVRQASVIAAWNGSPRRLEFRAAPAGLGAVVLLQAADLRILGAADLRPAAIAG